MNVLDLFGRDMNTDYDELSQINGEFTVVSHPVSPVWPVACVEHVRRQIVLVLSVYQLGCVVAGEPAVHALRPAVDLPALLNHRNRAVLHLQDGRGFRVSLCRKLCQSHFLIQELT